MIWLESLAKFGALIDIYSDVLYPSTYPDIYFEMKPSANIIIIEYALGFIFRCKSGFSSFTFCLINSLSLLFISTEKNILNISDFYSDILSFRFVIMHAQTVSNQVCGTGPLARYDGAESDEYLSDSNSYTDNESDLESDDYNNYESN